MHTKRFNTFFKRWMQFHVYLIMVLSNYSFFQFCDSNIKLFSIAPSKVIALNFIFCLFWYHLKFFLSHFGSPIIFSSTVVKDLLSEFCCIWYLWISNLILPLIIWIRIDNGFTFFFKSLTWKDCLFALICWRVKSFYRLSTKLKQKYIIYHLNNLMYKSLLNSNFNVRKDNNWSYLLFKTKFCSLPTPHTKF